MTQTDDDLRQVVGRQLTWLMEKRKIESQSELARIVEVYQTHISNMLAGRKLPSVAVLRRLAEALDTNPGFILGMTNDDAPHSDQEEQIILPVENKVRRELLQGICDSIANAPDSDLRIFLEVARRFDRSQAAARNREELWADLWSIVGLIGGDNLVQVFRRAMGDFGTGRGRNPGGDEFPKEGD